MLRFMKPSLNWGCPYYTWSGTHIAVCPQAQSHRNTTTTESCEQPTCKRETMSILTNYTNDEAGRTIVGVSCSKRKIPITTILRVLVIFSTVAIATGAPTKNVDVKSLFCAYGSVGIIPTSPPAGFESQFAVAVVEINSSKGTANVTVSDFVLFDQEGKATKAKRVIKVEEFDEPHETSEGWMTYYLKTAKNGGTRLWNSTLPAGRIRLRISVAFAEAPDEPVRFRVTVGPHVIEGPVDGSWPTGENRNRKARGELFFLG